MSTVHWEHGMRISVLIARHTQARAAPVQGGILADELSILLQARNRSQLANRQRRVLILQVFARQEDDDSHHERRESTRGRPRESSQ